MELKDTLKMPNTDFQMRGNLGVREVEMQKEWLDNNLYQEMLKKNEGKPRFVLHDGPPYANGSIHIGHALNKILKDFIIRYKNMNGFYAPYTPGWDTHGLPIENALTKVEKVDRKSMTTAEFRELCLAYAKKQVEGQKAQFMRLGSLGDYDNPYITFQKEFEYHQLRAFATMVEKGFIYKGLKPVYWSPSSESALAEAEIEYHDVKSPTIFVKMPIVEAPSEFEGGYLVIWTTTPWTIPANMAVCAGPSINYVLVETNKGKLVVGKDLLEKLTEKLELENVNVLAEYTGAELLGIKYKHPLYDRVQPLINGDYVTTEDGTGLVHIAPGHGLDDFLVCQDLGIEVYCPVDSKGYLDETTGRFAGLFVDDASKEVTKALDEIDCLLKLEWITHSYPHDWRTRKPIIFRATEQWFCSIESMKEDLLKAVDETKWVPSWGNLRMTNMIKDRKEWCISRQRAWGVPIPAIYTESGEAILDKDIILHFAEIVREEGTNAWYTKDVKDLLPEGYTHPGSPNGIFRKETDIMDVWFDSGTSYLGGQIPFGNEGQADLYLEGFDQFRGWFNSSLSTSVAITGKAPYKQVVSHGFVLDGKGEKMSKSLGNTIDPNKVCATLGADILRLWVLSVSYDQDVRVSDEILKQIGEGYRKIRNTFKFMLGNVSDFNPETNRVAYEALTPVDKYMLYKTNELVKEYKNAFDNYSFNEAYKLLMNFISKDLSSFYLDFTKDILYIEKEDSLTRRATQTVYFDILDCLVRLLTPVIPHTANEAYQFMPGERKMNSQLLDMPEVKEYEHDLEFEMFMTYRDDVLKALELARNEKVIGKSFEAHLTCYIDEAHANLAKVLEYVGNARQILIVSKLTVKTSGNGKYESNGYTFDVEKASGHTCARCWQIVDEVTEDGLCPRCQEIVNSLK